MLVMVISRRALLGSSATFGSAAGNSPNVIFLISDDHGWSDYGFMRHAHVQTPHIDRLAREGLTLTRGYVPTSLCRPSLASIMTGLYPHQHRITSNDPAGDARDAANRAAMVRVFQESKTIAGLLGGRGYVSHQSGKWWEGECKCGGFTECMTHGEVGRGGRHGDEGLKIGRQTMQPVFDFLDRVAGRPFFLWYAPMLPHTPHNPPDRLLAKHTKPELPVEVSKYHAMIEWLDEGVGQLLDYLDHKGLTENTIVAYLADNGWIQQGSTPFWETPSKLSPYDAGVRTPIILRWPGRIRPERDDTALASSVDLAATVLPACGIRPLREMPGINLLDRGARRRRDAIFGAIFAHTAVDIANPRANRKYRWIVRGRHKLIVPDPVNAAVELWPNRPMTSWSKAEVELFDVVDDPWEERDLAVLNPRLASELRRRLDRWWG
jgi:uncharacterized sulfatase